MENKIKQKIIAITMLTVFTFANTGITTLAANSYTDYGYAKDGNSRINAPVLRGNGSTDNIKLTGDVSFTTRKIPVTLSLRDSDVSQVLRMFADKAGYNIIFYTDVDSKVTMDLVNVPLNSAFEMVMNIAKLTYAIQDNTLIIAKADDKDFNMAKQQLSIIPVKYVGANIIATFLNKNIYSMNKLGSSGKDIAVTNPATNEIMIFGTKQDVQIAQKVISEFDKKPLTTTFKINHTTPKEMASMICNMLVPAISGKDAGGSSTGGAAGIATGFASSSTTSSSSDLTVGGGDIACTVSPSMTAGDYESMGLNNLSIAYFSQLGTISVFGGSENQVETIKDFIAQMDKKQPQAYLEVSIIELSEDGSKTLDNVWNVNTNFISASFNDGSTRTLGMSPIFVMGKSLPLYSNTYTTTTDAEKAKTSTIGYEKIGDLVHWPGERTITWAINYALSNKKGRVVANPRILITNGQESTIDLTSDYVQSTDSEMTASGTGNFATKTYNIASDDGIKVSITPFISPDGYVTMNIKPEYATIKSQETAIDQYGTSYIANTLLQRRNLDLKNVRIKDGETLVIGGMIQEVETKTVKKIPGLGDMPVVGAIFRSSATTKTKEEMLIMLTPKIITDTEDATSVKTTL